MVLTGHEGFVLRTTDHGQTFREVLAAGVYRHYGGGLPLCLDARAGVDAFVLWPRVCPPIMRGRLPLTAGPAAKAAARAAARRRSGPR